MSSVIAQLTTNGAAVDVSGMGRDKSIFISDEFKGQLYIEARAGSGDWVNVARAISGQKIIKLNLLASDMRINTTKSSWTGDPPTVEVSAEGGTVTATTMNGPYEEGDEYSDGTAVSNSGGQTTFFCTGLTKGSCFVEGVVNGAPEVLARFDAPNAAYKTVNAVYSTLRWRRTDRSITPVVTLASTSELPSADAGGAAGDTAFQSMSGRYDFSATYNPIALSIKPGPMLVRRVHYRLEISAAVDAGTYKVQVRTGGSGALFRSAAHDPSTPGTFNGEIYPVDGSTQKEVMVVDSNAELTVSVAPQGMDGTISGTLHYVVEYYAPVGLPAAPTVNIVTITLPEEGEGLSVAAPGVLATDIVLGAWVQLTATTVGTTNPALFDPGPDVINENGDDWTLASILGKVVTLALYRPPV